MIPDLASRVGRYVERHRLIEPGATVIVAVSGGTDSLCLLHMLLELAPEWSLRLHVAHLDHALRDASQSDAAFVARHSDSLGLPYSIERREVRQLARQRRLSLEAAGREARYTFLGEIAARIGARAIATGHTRDDQAETVLLHLARGSGLAGLAGMRPRHGSVVRPLLEVSRAETEAYCRAHGMVPLDDASNRGRDFARNRVRLDLLPLLDTVAPHARENAARAACLIAADLKLIERLAARELTAATTVSGDEARIDVQRWNEAEPELHPHMLRLLLTGLLGSADGFTARHYAALTAALARDGRAHTTVSLPQGLVLSRDGQEARLGPRRIATSLTLSERFLPVPGELPTVAGVLCAELATAPPRWEDIPSETAYLDRTAVGDTLSVRGWRPGDRMRPLGMTGSRKVQDIFVDCKVAPLRRPLVPIVVGPRGIAWLAGLRVSAEYAVGAGAPAVQLTWRAIEG